MPEDFECALPREACGLWNTAGVLHSARSSPLDQFGLYKFDINPPTLTAVLVCGCVR